jgi:N6-adenosine-specific RNA methylase IME4
MTLNGKNTDRLVPTNRRIVIFKRQNKEYWYIIGLPTQLDGKTIFSNETAPRKNQKLKQN